MVVSALSTKSGFCRQLFLEVCDYFFLIRKNKVIKKNHF